MRQHVHGMLRRDSVGDPSAELRRIRLANTGGFKLAHGIMTEQLYQDTKVVMHCTQVEWDLYTRWVTEILTPKQNARWVYMEMGNRKWSACLKKYIIETLVIAINNKFQYKVSMLTRFETLIETLIAYKFSMNGE